MYQALSWVGRAKCRLSPLGAFSEGGKLETTWARTKGWKQRRSAQRASWGGTGGLPEQLGAPAPAGVTSSSWIPRPGHSPAGLTSLPAPRLLFRVHGAHRVQWGAAQLWGPNAWALTPSFPLTVTLGK